MRTFILFICLNLALGYSVSSAATYQIPINDNIVGEMFVVTAKRGDTLNRIAVRNGVGYNEILRANPKLRGRKLRIGTQVVVPTEYVLPSVDYQGIVINLSAMRLYYFPDEFTVMTFPVAIGKKGWRTPMGVTQVVAKLPHPTWTPPASIIREAEKKGRKLKKVYPAGPNNPLGTRALRLGISGYLIHGTNKPWTIGQRRSHGCIRMRRKDVEELFDYVSVGTPVRIISQRIKSAKLSDLSQEEIKPKVIRAKQHYPKTVNATTSSEVAGYRQPMKFENENTIPFTEEEDIQVIDNHISDYRIETYGRDRGYKNLTNNGIPMEIE